MDDVYQEIILDHYKEPRNRGVVAKGEGISVHNGSCGDHFSGVLEFEGERVIKMTWNGEGCAMSTASMSLVSEWVVGKTREELQQFKRDDILSLFGLSTISSGREKCVTLPLRLVREAVAKSV